MAALRCLRRQLSLSLSGSAVYAALSDHGKKSNTLLLETADNTSADAGKSLAFVSSCLRVTGMGSRVHLQALNQNGEQALNAFLSRCQHRIVAGDTHTATIEVLAAPDTDDEIERLQNDGAYHVLRDFLAVFATQSAEDESLLQLVGAFGFETIENYERFTPFSPTRTQPDFVLLLPEIIVSVPRRGGVQIAALVFDGERADRVHNDMSRQIAEIAEQLQSAAEVGPPPQQVFKKSAYSVSVNDEQFCEQVEQAKAHLLAGDAFQIVISRQFTLPCRDAFRAYCSLRHNNPSPYLFYAQFGDQIVLGASPESAVKVDASTRQVEVLPIAGTRVRGRDQHGAIDLDLDARLEAELRLDSKEVAEHMMLVDLARNDVARVAKPGTRHVADLLKVERYARVMHLVSRVRAELKPELHALHALAASMPMGTLSGAPKIRAIEIIRQIEKRERGFYGGAVGYINARGDMDTAIVIRSAVIREGVACVQAGAGIVLGSDPQAEADETTRKAEAVLRAVVAGNVQGEHHAV